MKLSPKATRFVIEALDYRIEAYRVQLETADLDEDEAADVGNDVIFGSGSARTSGSVGEC